MTEAAAQSLEADPPPFRLKIIPILVVIVLGMGLPYLGAFIIGMINKYVWPLPGYHGTWSYLYWQHGSQFLLALVTIAILKGFVKTDYGLHWPRGRTYVGSAIGWGVFFGVLMTVVDYWPDLLAHRAPKFGDPLTTQNIAGWLTFEGIYVGPTEEVPFRALLVGYLAAAMPGRLTIGRVNMNWAGVIVALIFALAHVSSFWTQPVWLATGQQAYAFALGVLYAYWFEKSRSVLAPIIGHNLSDVVEYVLMFLLIFAWR